jgi:hypothetical protein
MRLVVYLCHPLGNGEDREQNRHNASAWVAWAALHHHVSPVADWIILSGRLDESHRELGLECDVALVKLCNAVWLCGGRVSPGMRIEATAAFEEGIPVWDLSEMGFKPPEGYRDISGKLWKP